MKKDLILGTCWGYSLEKISPFVLSWKKYCSETTSLYLVVDPGINKKTAEFLQDNGVILKSFFAAHFIPDSLNQSRYFKYFDILSEEKGKYDGVLLTDIRDVVLQGNPFNEQTRTGIHFFLEDESVIIGPDAFGSSCMRYNYGEKVLEELYNERVICSGTTIGDQTSILRYLYTLSGQRNLAKMMKVVPLVGSYMFDNPPIDQAIHQYIYYKNLITATLHENGDIVSTLAQTPPEKISINDDGMMLLNGVVSPIVHQWDRHEDLTDHVAKMYNSSAEEIKYNQEKGHYVLGNAGNGS